MLIAIMTELFAVVKFTEENDAIDVVPTMWIINNDTASWYPNVTSDETKNSLVKRCAQVDTKTWTENPIKVLGKYKTYHEAMEKVHIAEVQSNLSDDTVVTQKKRSRKRKNLKYPGEDSTSETDAEGSRKETRKHHKKSQSKLAANGSGKLVYKNFPDPPSISPKRSNVLNFNNEARIDVSDSSSSAHEYLGSDDDVVHPVVHQQVPSQTAPQKANSQADGSTSAVTLEDVLARLSYLQTSLDSVLEATKNFSNQLSLMNTKLDALNNNSEDQHKIKVAVINSIPAKTPDDLELLNKAIQGSQAAKLQLETTLKAVAEQKVLNTAQNMMHKLFTDELGTQYCLKGKNPDKKQFDIDPIYHLVIECIKTVFPPTEKVVTEAREAISNWFTQSKHRIDKRKKRAEEKVKNAAQKEAERVKKAAEEEAERVKKAAAEAAEKAKKAAEEEAERVKKAAAEAAEKAKKAAEEEAERAKKAAEKAKT